MSVTSSDEDALEKCLAICQTLASQGRDFHLKIKVGNNFNFSLDSRKGKGKDQAKPRRMTPSAMRRRERRKAIRQSTQAPISVAPVTVAERATDESIEATAEIVAAKSEEATEKAAEEECDQCDFDCIQCDRSFKKKNALAVHVGKEHKTIEQLDGAYTSINEEMSFDHDKEEEEDEDESWKVVRSRRRSREKFRTWCQKIDVLWENRIAYMDIDEYEGDEK